MSNFDEEDRSSSRLRDAEAVLIRSSRREGCFDSSEFIFIGVVRMEKLGYILLEIAKVSPDMIGCKQK
jgi:hypothetical protein